jgi:hypothetical protein
VIFRDNEMAGAMASTGDNRNEHRILMRKYEGKKSHVIFGRRWEGDTKINLKSIVGLDLSGLG